MGDHKDLANQEGIKKIKELAEDISVCMFCTHSDERMFETRPMGTQKVDDDGNLWFLTGENSDKNQEIKDDSDVQLIYSKVSDAKFLSVAGRATITKDRQKIEELWNKMAEAWFKGGKDDPNLSAIKVAPTEAYYWDTKNGKMITLMKIAISAVSGAKMDGGIEGKISV